MMPPCKGRWGARSPRKVASVGTVARPRATMGRGRLRRVLGTIPSSSTSLVPSRKARTVSAAIRQIVQRVWTEDIAIPPEWSPQEREAFFASEGERLVNQINVMHAEQQQVVIRDWRTRNGGKVPDHLTHVGLINLARSQCEEIVLTQELYELVPVGEEDRERTPLEEQIARERWEDNEQQAWDAAQSDPDRWKTEYAPDPTYEVYDTTQWLWPDKTLSWRVSAACLWQVWAEDNRPLPSIPMVAGVEGSWDVCTAVVGETEDAVLRHRVCDMKHLRHTRRVWKLHGAEPSRFVLLAHLYVL